MVAAGSQGVASDDDSNLIDGAVEGQEASCAVDGVVVHLDEGVPMDHEVGDRPA